QNLHPLQPRPFPDCSSGPRRCPRLQLRGSAGLAPASLFLCCDPTGRRTRTRVTLESRLNLHSRGCPVNQGLVSGPECISQSVPSRITFRLPRSINLTEIRTAESAVKTLERDS